MLAPIVRTHTLRPFAAAALAFVALLLAFAAAPARAEVPAFVQTSEWSEVRSPRFVVITDAGAGVAADAARKLERLVQVMAKVNPGLRPAAPGALEVVVLRDASELKTYASALELENVAGLHGQGVDREWLVVAASMPGMDRTEVLYHEYLHSSLHANLVTLPLWLNEGLAMYYSTLRISGTAAEVGRASADMLEWCRAQDQMTFDEMFAMQAEAASYRKGSDYGHSFYAQSWALVHYLQSASGGRAEKFSRYLDRLRTGTAARRAFVEVFGEADLNAMPAQLKDYMGRIEFENTRRVVLGDRLEDVPLRERALPQAEALTCLGTMLLGGGNPRPALAREHVALALATDSSFAPARAAWGYLEDLDGRTDAAEAQYARAAALAPSDPLPPLWAGLGVLRRTYREQSSVPRGGATPEAMLLARRRFAKSLALGATSVEAFAGYGRTFLLDARADTSALHALQRALDLAPGRTDVASDLAQLEALAGNRAASEALIRDRVATAASAGQTREVRAAADDAQLQQADDLARAERWAEADSLLTGIVATAGDTQLGDKARKRLVMVRSAHAQAKFAELTTAGVTAANRKDWAIALKAFEQSEAYAVNDDMRQTAAQNLATTRVNITLEKARPLIRANRLREARKLWADLLAQPLPDEARDFVKARVHEIDQALGTAK